MPSNLIPQTHAVHSTRNYPCGSFTPLNTTSQLSQCHEKFNPPLDAVSSRECLRDDLSSFLVSEYYTEHLASKTVCKPFVLEHGDLERLAAKGRVEICVDRSTHSLENDQIGAVIPHHLTQVKVNVSATCIPRVRYKKMHFLSVRSVQKHLPTT